MMKKIAIVTLYKDNFGSILQAYSTYSYLTNLGYDCELLEQSHNNSLTEKIKKFPRVLFKCLRYREFLSDRLKAKKSWKEDISLLDNMTHKKMDEFVNSVFTVNVVDIRKLNSIKDDYDYFIVGSDQVWNGYNPFRFLEFVDKKKRIAFAPSFGSEVKDYNKADVRRGLMGFDKLSVREESGVRTIKELIGKDVVRIADPTLLLSREDWLNFSKKGRQQKNYILLHFLNKPNEIAVKTIKEYQNKHNCTAYCICNKYEDFNQLIRYEFIDITPQDYISLINNADLVFTDSFHSTLFSLNLETQFLTFERQYIHGNSQSSRIIDLLSRVGMENRLWLDNQNDICYDKFQSWNSDELFFDERKCIREYLKKSLTD